MCHCLGLFGRIFPNYASDRYIGPLNTLIVLAAVTSVLLLTWIAVHDQGGLTAFAVVYGFFAAGEYYLNFLFISSGLSVSLCGRVSPRFLSYPNHCTGVQSLFPAALSSLTDDLQKAGVRMGVVFSIVSIFCLTGPPIAGALIQTDRGDYLYAQLFAGISMLVGSVTLVLSRVLKTGPSWKVKL